MCVSESDKNKFTIDKNQAIMPEIGFDQLYNCVWPLSVRARREGIHVRLFNFSAFVDSKFEYAECCWAQIFQLKRENGNESRLSCAPHFSTVPLPQLLLPQIIAKTISNMFEHFKPFEGLWIAKRWEVFGGNVCRALVDVSGARGKIKMIPENFSRERIVNCHPREALVE